MHRGRVICRGSERVRWLGFGVGLDGGSLKALLADADKAKKGTLHRILFWWPC